MAQKTRSELQVLFQTGAKPSQQDFTDFIESTLNRKDDGIEKPSGAGVPLKIMAQGDDEKLLDFYREETKTWSISQKSGDEEGLNISNSSGESKLFIDSSSGNVGIGTTTPEAKLSVNGGLHVGGNSDPGDNNLLVDGTTTTNGLSVLGSLSFSNNIQLKINLHDERYGIGVQANTQYFRTQENFAWYKGGIHDNSELNPGDDGTVQMVIKNGKVGIGTAIPGAKLSINGGLHVGGDSNPGDNNLLVDGTTTTSELSVSGSLNFSNPTLQKINLHAELYGIGIQSYTQYFRTLKNFAWYKDGTHHDNELNPGGGTVQMVIKDGNVGIGTDTPDAKLDVRGALKVNGSLDVNHSSVNIGGEFATTTLTIEATNTAGNSGRTTCINLIGYENRGKGLYFSDIGNDEKWFIGTGYSSREFSIGYSETGEQADYKENAKFFVKRNGNVGIGTDAPGAKLDVAGALKFSGTGTLIFHNTSESDNSSDAMSDGFRIKYDNNFFETNTSNDALVIEKTDGHDTPDPDGGIAFVNTGLNGIPQTALVIRGDGKVGIGTKSPEAKLEVNGDIKVEGKFIGNLNIKDTRDQNEAPNTFNKVISFDFKTRTVVGVPGSGQFSGMLTIAPWEADSGDAHHQLNFNEGGIFWRQGQPSATTWEDWYRIANDGMTDNFSFMGNVGIGTTTTEAKLSINGGLHVGGNSDPGDNNLLVDGTTTTNELSVLGNLEFSEEKRQKINLYAERYGIGMQSNTQYFRTNKNFAWYKGGTHNNSELNPGADGTVQMVIKNGNVGIGKDDPDAKLDVAGTIKGVGVLAGIWSAQPTNDTSINSSSWTNVSNTSVTFTLDRNAVIFCTYSINVQPSGDPNSDWVGTRLKVGNTAYRQSGSHYQPYTNSHSNMNLTGNLVLDLDSGQHTVYLQWRKAGSSSSWQSYPSWDDDYIGGRTLVVMAFYR